MEIIKPGDSKNLYRVRTCDACGCEFKFHSIAEVQSTFNGNKYINCPQLGCGNRVILT